MKKKCQWNFHLQRNLFMNCLKAMGKTFHPECFVCAYCGKIFANSPFYLEDGLPYCEEDWNELFTTKCVSCGFPIEAGDRWVEALNNNYHSQCFNCTLCKKNLEGKGFFVKAGKPFCKSHARMGIWNQSSKIQEKNVHTTETKIVGIFNLIFIFGWTKKIKTSLWRKIYEMKMWWSHFLFLLQKKISTNQFYPFYYYAYVWKKSSKIQFGNFHWFFLYRK